MFAGSWQPWRSFSFSIPSNDAKAAHFEVTQTMSRYLQKISLRPYSDAEIWTGWELENRSGEIEGLILADGISDDELRKKYGVTEFQKIPSEYLDPGEYTSRTG